MSGSLASMELSVHTVTDRMQALMMSVNRASLPPMFRVTSVVFLSRYPWSICGSSPLWPSFRML